MNFIKKYKNPIILILIITSIVFSTNAIDFITSSAKKIEKMFSTSKSDYSNLSSQDYKIKNTAKNPSTKTKSDSSKNEGARSMFKNNKKEPSPEELDKQIMQNNDTEEARRKKIFERSTRQFEKDLDQKKMSEEKFDMDMEKEFENF